LPKTLVIDDDQLTEQHFRSYLQSEHEHMQSRFTFAKSDAEALSIIENTNDIDVALIAVDSDALSGLSLFRQLSERRFRVPRIALTTKPDIDVIRKAMNQGAADFLVKPFSFDDVTLTIDKVYKDVEQKRRNWRERAEYSALRREIDIAADLQQRILPKSFPGAERLDIFANVTPAKDMGGDFYDCFEITPGKLAFIIADVSGKSVPAAFYMAVARTLLRAQALNSETPADCLFKVNNLLCQHDIPGMFVSVFLGFVDLNTFVVDYANGGHLPPFILHNNRAAHMLDGGNGTVLGVMENLPYENGKMQLSPNEALFLYTDGLTEAFNRERQQFGEDRLEQALLSAIKGPAADISKTVNNCMHIFCNGAPVHDDVTSILVKRR